MAARKKWRISFKVKNANVVITEFLRYSGVIGINNRDHSSLLPLFVMNTFSPLYENETIVTIYEPSSIEGETWAKMNAARISSFGVKAVIWSD